MKKKVGLLTWHYLDNYGSVLQAYALKEVFNKLKCDVEFINYRKDAANNIFINVLRNVYYYLNIFAKDEIKRKRSFFLFRKKYFKETKLFSNIEQLKNFNFNYNLYVCGSDQIWASNRYDEAYYLTFTDGKKMSYAPSLVFDSFTKENKVKIKEYLKSFFSISLREKKGIEILKTFTNYDYTEVLDPTLLLKNTDWNKLIKKERVKGKDYVLCYFIGDDDKYRESVQKFSKDNNLKIKNIQLVDIHNFGEGNKKDASPVEFLELIRNAKYVLTDSYHGVLFSLNYNKNFYAFKRFSNKSKDNQNGRIENILNICKLENRFIDIVDKMEFNNIDYTQINKILNKKRKESMEYIKKGLED